MAQSLNGSMTQWLNHSMAQSLNGSIPQWLNPSIPQSPFDQIQRIKQQRKRRVSLSPMLWPQAKQHNSPGIHFDRYNRSATRHQLFAFQPSRRHNIGVRIAGNHRSLLRSESFNKRKERAVIIKSISLGR